MYKKIFGVQNTGRSTNRELRGTKPAIWLIPLPPIKRTTFVSRTTEIFETIAQKFLYNRKRVIRAGGNEIKQAYKIRSSTVRIYKAIIV